MAASINYPPGVGQWMPTYTRDIERAIDDAVAGNNSTVSTFSIDGGDATTSFSSGGSLLVDFGGAA